MLIKRSPNGLDLPYSSEITPQAVYEERRNFIKAMALGATSVGIGRPYIWGLGAFGQEGVEAVLGLLRKEFEVAMKQSGTRSLAEITLKHITPA